MTETHHALLDPLFAPLLEGWALLTPQQKGFVLHTFYYIKKIPTQRVEEGKYMRRLMPPARGPVDIDLCELGRLLACVSIAELTGESLATAVQAYGDQLTNDYWREIAVQIANDFEAGRLIIELEHVPD